MEYRQPAGELLRRSYSEPVGNSDGSRHGLMPFGPERGLEREGRGREREERVPEERGPGPESRRGVSPEREPEERTRGESRGRREEGKNHFLARRVHSRTFTSLCLPLKPLPYPRIVRR